MDGWQMIINGVLLTHEATTGTGGGGDEGVCCRLSGLEAGVAASVFVWPGTGGGSSGALVRVRGDEGSVRGPGTAPSTLADGRVWGGGGAAAGGRAQGAPARGAPT